MNFFVPIVDNALILAGLAYWSNRPINKAKTVIPGGPLSQGDPLAVMALLYISSE